MNKRELSRRRFLSLSASGLAVSAGTAMLPRLAQAAGIKVTAGELMGRIKQQVHVPWREGSVDTIKGGGSPETVVTGVTTTFMATLDVLQKSVKAGNNFILTHEPTFWSLTDGSEGLADDPLYLHKLEYIQSNRLFVHRFHDHWHARKPDGIFEGWDKVMGWNLLKFDASTNAFELPHTVTLADYASEVKRRLQSDAVRAIGDPRLKVNTVRHGSNKLPRKGDSTLFPDVTITYEPDRENGNVEWERDTTLAGQKRGFIIVSHNRMEEAGMDNCATWLRTFVSEVPIQFIPSGEPFWRTTS